MQHALWQSVLGEIELSVSHATFMTWFKNTDLAEVNDQAVIITVPNIFAKRQFEVKFNDQIKSILEKNGVNPTAILYEVKSTGKKTLVSRETTATRSTSTAAVDTLLTPTQKKTLPTSGLNSRYTFDGFIVGSCNDLAYAACQAVAKNPGTKR